MTDRAGGWEEEEGKEKGRPAGWLASSMQLAARLPVATSSHMGVGLVS